MDRGIICNLKHYYRKNLLRAVIDRLDNNNEIFEPNLLQAFRMLDAAWTSISPETLRNCFRSAGFVNEDQEPDKKLENAMQEMGILWSNLGLESAPDGLTLPEFLNIDENVATSCEPNLQEMETDESFEDNV